jgi:2-amino-4-hydroxy-6-hydroxymethyldihydropteridine diphosphokinase
VRGHLSQAAAASRYLVALGSNRRHPRHGDPRRVLVAALAALAEEATVIAAAPVVSTAPLGPSRRRYANGAALVETPLTPPQLLARLKQIERAFGRRSGQRWGARVLDLDIVLWDQGRWHGGSRHARLRIPHPHYHRRGFVLVPAARIASRWRDPHSGLSIAQLAFRLVRPARDLAAGA